MCWAAFRPLQAVNTDRVCRVSWQVFQTCSQEIHLKLRLTEKNTVLCGVLWVRIGDDGCRMCGMGRTQTNALHGKLSQWQSEVHLNLYGPTPRIPKYLSFTQVVKLAKGMGFPFSRDWISSFWFQNLSLELLLTGNVCSIVWTTSRNYLEKISSFFFSFSFLVKSFWALGCIKLFLIISIALHKRHYSFEIRRTVCRFGYWLMSMMT